jgi:hypothetical protein
MGTPATMSQRETTPEAPRVTHHKRRTTTTVHHHDERHTTTTHSEQRTIMMVAIGIIVQSIGICDMLFQLTLVQAFLNKILVTFVLTNPGLIQVTHSDDPGFEGLFLFGFAVFDTIFQSVIQVGIKLVT